MSTTIDQQFVEFIVKSLVNKPEAVTIERRIDEKGVLLELTVDPDDLGRIIGKRGATAQSLRTLLRALGTKNDARYNLKIVDNDGDGEGGGSGGMRDDMPQDIPVDDGSSGQAVDEPTDQPVDEEESATIRTRKELAAYDDLDI